MFFPVDSLRRGGRFYLCWIADLWPLRFEKITYRNQHIWSEDIRETCDHLRALMISESGHPKKRFSLRLSSQLLRGLTRIYKKKVDVFFRDLWKTNISIMQYRSHPKPTKRPATSRTPRRTGDRRSAVTEEIPEEENVEIRLENTVARIEDITLREPTLPEIRLLEDGFGELNQDPVELMLAHDVSAAQRSALELPPDLLADKSHDKSRLAPHDAAQMERISEYDMSLFHKSAADASLFVDLEKEIPEISEILPELPAPVLRTEQSVERAEIDDPSILVRRSLEPQDIILEELEEEPQKKRRKLRNKLIIDKNIKISSDHFRVRIALDDVGLRSANVDPYCETPADTYLSRPAHCGVGRALTRMSTFGQTLGAMFTKRLANARKKPSVVEDIEEAMIQKAVPLERTEQQMEVDVPAEKTVQEPDVLDVVMQDISNIQLDVQMADLPTQKILTDSQEKRGSESHQTMKRKSSQRMSSLNISAIEANKENIPAAEPISVTTNIQGHKPSIVLTTEDPELRRTSAEHVTSLLEEAGMSQAPEIEPGTAHKNNTHGSGSETPLGSLDRTKVSLGESEKTTESKKLIDEEWGVRGTMLKILRCVELGKRRITVQQLLRCAPLAEPLAARSRLAAAKCFISVLKLKSNGFIKIIKAENNEIQHMELGPRITNET